MPKKLPVLTLLLFLIATVAAPAEKPVLPTGPLHPWILFCMSVKGVPFSMCSAWLPEQGGAGFREAARGNAAVMGLYAANAYYPPDTVAPSQADRLREYGRKIMEAAPGLAFPELGDSRKGATGWCVCAKSLDGTDLSDPYILRGTGGGGCTDWVTCQVDGVPGDPKP